MKVSHSEEVADRAAPESWLFSREGKWQALTGEGMGWVLSREISIPECRRRSCVRKATPGTPPWRGVSGLREVIGPTHVPKLLARNPGGPMAGPALWAWSVWPTSEVQP